MNERLLNHPIPPSIADPSVTPQLQEVLYRALERDPQNRYPNAHAFLHDLVHLNQVGVEDRDELKNWQRSKARTYRKILYYGALAMIPVAVLIIMMLIASRH
jgi:eukaryotic-like serine/threonine-protein kinase